MSRFITIALLYFSLSCMGFLYQYKLHRRNIFKYSNNVLIYSVLNEDNSKHNVLNSLTSGNWVKFICGASNQDLPLIRNLCYLYTIAGVDCIDMSSDVAVIQAALGGISAAMKDSKDKSFKPYIMISVNDDDDLHFRKASFNPKYCPTDCLRPCEKVCPALAIPPQNITITNNYKQIDIVDSKNSNSSNGNSNIEGVIAAKCYGCGRCIPTCPYDLIEAKSYQIDKSDISMLLSLGMINAIEIHTDLKHTNSFMKLWDAISFNALNYLDIIAISFPNIGNDTLIQLQTLQHIITSNIHYSSSNFKKHGIQIWQTDGRPMSGDIGKGTVHASIELAQLLLNSNITDKNLSINSRNVHLNNENQINFQSNKHFVQLAGGTNNYSVIAANEQGIVKYKGFGGYAFGGYARKYIGKYLNQLEHDYPGANIENHIDILKPCLDFANNLIKTVK